MPAPFLRSSEDTSMTDGSGYPLLRVDGLISPSFSSSKAPIFSDLSLDLHAGEVLCIQGPSGAGKSVLLKCIAHLLVFTHGFIYLHGHEAEELKGGIPAWRAKIMYLPQRPALLPGTPEEFWDTIVKYESRKHVRQARKDPVHIADNWRIDRSKWKSSWTQLSGGEAQRIALAIALALQPEVLLLDGMRGLQSISYPQTKALHR